jgi:DNA-binding winged helix-turn-helix (wHTH) protein/tetratricopeptide (TPR) repeat protein
LEGGDQIDLARIAPFQLGLLKIEPALRQVSTTRLASETLEPRVMQVLVALASANGAVVTRDELIRRCWEGRIVGEDSISRTIARLRKLAEDHGDTGFHIETITKVGYRLIGAPVTGISVPDQHSPTASVPESPTRTSGRASRYAMLAAGVAALLALAWFALRPAPHSLTATLRIGSFTALSTGLPATLPATLQSELLAQNSGLTNPWITIGRDAPVDSAQSYRVSGTLRQTGDTVHTIINLAHEGSGEILLSQPFDQPITAGDAGLRNLVGKATTNIQCALTYGVQGRHVALPLTTQRLLAQWCQANNASEPNPAFELATVRAMLKSSPDFALAWAWLATSLTAGIPDAEKMAGQPAYDEAMAALRTAERLGPPSYVIETARARLLPSTDQVAREGILRRSAERFSTETGGFAAYTYGNFLFNVGRVDDAIAQQQLALKLNPGRLAWRVRMIDLLLAAGQVEEADSLLNRLFAEAQEPDVALDTRVSEALRRGQPDAAGMMVANAVRVHPQLKAAMAQAVAAAKDGNAAARNQAAAQLVALSQAKPTRARFIVATLAALGHDADALQVADGLLAGAAVPPTQIFFQPALAGARALPTFTEIAARSGLTRYWQKSRQPPDFCSLAAAPALCAQLIPHPAPSP